MVPATLVVWFVAAAAHSCHECARSVYKTQGSSESLWEPQPPIIGGGTAYGARGCATAAPSGMGGGRREDELILSVVRILLAGGIARFGVTVAKSCIIAARDKF